MKNKLTTDSATVIINTIAQQKIDAGIRLFNLSAGEPKLHPHPVISQAVSEALALGKVFYPPVRGIPELIELAVEWINVFYGSHFQTNNCLVVNGGKLGLYLLLQSLLEAGDEVIMASPYWVSYPTIVKLFAGLPIIIPTTEFDGWKLTIDALEKAYTSKSKILILNNACNPTGALYTETELAALLQFADDNDLLVISDEVYSGLTYDGASYISCGKFIDYQQRVIIIQSCSKNFSMTGWRVGFVLGPSDIIKQVASLLSQSTSGVTTISQWAAVAVLEQASIVNGWVRDTMMHRRNILIDSLNKHFRLCLAPPPSSLYVFLSLEQLGVKKINSEEFCKLVLEEANVALVPGKAFGKEGFVRMSFGGQDEDLVLGVKALSVFCKHNF